MKQLLFFLALFISSEVQSDRILKSPMSSWNERSQKVALIPEITSDYVHIYDPEGDVFLGPDTKNLVAEIGRAHV